MIIIIFANDTLIIKVKKMSTAALSGLRDYLCGTLPPADMIWLSGQLEEFARMRQAEEELPPPLPRFTMDEINAMLDRAEQQAKEGKSVPNDEVWRRMKERRRAKQEHVEQIEELSIAVWKLYGKILRWSSWNR